MSVDVAAVLDSLANVPVLDEAALREITEAAGMTPMELVDMFLEDTAMNLDAMQIALTQGDRESLNRAAHTMKSSAGNVGAQRFACIAKAIEMATKQTVASDAAPLLTHLVNAFSEFNVHVTQHAAELSS